jgi:hypothetical protein
VSQTLIAQFFVLAAVVLILVHRWAANRWLGAYTARYGRLPKGDWFRTVDPDPAIERLRRWRIAVLIPTIASFGIAMILLLTSVS